MTAPLTRTRYITLWALGILATAGVLLFCLCIGPNDLNHTSLAWPDQSFLDWRLRRVGTAALVGEALSASGVLLQGLLKNPLADPYVLGISSGSNVSVMLWIVLATPLAKAFPALAPLLQNGQAFPALLGALAACLIVFAVTFAVARGQLDPLTLLLVGVVFSAFCGALVMLLNSVRPHGVDANIMNFLIGYVSDGTPPLQIYIGLAIFILGWLTAISLAGPMNIASLSDSEAASLGIRLARLRSISFLAAAIMTAASIALSRSIGFVGLICPHICRLLFGPDHRQLIVTAPFAGAIFLMLADALVQFLRDLFPFPLEVGVVTALLGAPFFLLLLARRGGITHD